MATTYSIQGHSCKLGVLNSCGSPELFQKEGISKLLMSLWHLKGGRIGA